MKCYRAKPEDMVGIEPLHIAYKLEIGEDAPGREGLDNLRKAVEEETIFFYACEEDGRPVGCCSVSPTFSTFNYQKAGVFEDFYILPEYRHRGIARKLVEFACRDSGVGSLTVGCADCDRVLYAALGFSIPLGNLLAYDPE